MPMGSELVPSIVINMYHFARFFEDIIYAIPGAAAIKFDRGYGKNFRIGSNFFLTPNANSSHYPVLFHLTFLLAHS